MNRVEKLEKLFFAWKKGIFFCYDLAFTVSQKQQQVFVAFSKESHQKFVVGFCNEICQPRGKSYRRKDRLYFSSIPPRIPIVLQASIPQVSFGRGRRLLSVLKIAPIAEEEKERMDTHKSGIQPLLE